MPTSMYDYEIQHLQQLRPHLADCTVLLKTDGAFPLSAPCRIAAYGNGVRHTIKGGTGSGEVNSRSFVTAEEGLTRAGFTVTSGRWLDGYDAVRIRARRDFLRRMKAEARQAGVNVLIYGMGRVMPEPDYTLPLDADGEAAVYVLARISGEGSDRTPAKGDIRLTDTEVRDILALNERYRQFLLVLNVGGVVDLSPVQTVRNILVLSQLGDATGDVLADLLLGAGGALRQADHHLGHLGGVPRLCRVRRPRRHPLQPRASMWGTATLTRWENARCSPSGTGCPTPVSG